jgi:hypothetical protein
MRSQVSGKREVELKCLSSVGKIPLMGLLAFPFMGQGRDPGYKSEGERGKEKERSDGVDSPGATPPSGRVLRVLQTTMEARACCGYVRLRRYRRASLFWS